MRHWSPHWEKLVLNYLGFDLIKAGKDQIPAGKIKRLHKIFSAHDGYIHNNYTYGNNPDYRDAYLYYYLMANMPKVVYVVHELVSFLKKSDTKWNRAFPMNSKSDQRTGTTHEKSLKHLKILDLGSGPGTASLGAIIAFYQCNEIRFNIDITCVDKSGSFLKAASEISNIFRDFTFIKGKTETVRFNFDKKFYQRKQHRYDLVFLTNVLSEIESDNQAERIVKMACNHLNNNGFLVLISPAFKRTSRRLSQIRDKLIFNGYHLIAPCPGQYKCPIIKNKNDWCHHRLFWTQPPFMKKIDSKTGFHNSFLNFSYFVFSPKQSTIIPQTSRGKHSSHYFLLISEVKSLKNGWYAYLCGGDNQFRIFLDKNNLNLRNEIFVNLNRYDQIMIDNFEISKNEIQIRAESSIIQLKNWQKIS